MILPLDITDNGTSLNLKWDYRTGVAPAGSNAALEDLCLELSWRLRAEAFTGLTAVDDDGVVAEAKVSSSGDIATVLGQGLTLLAGNMGLDMEELLSRVPLVVHGTTVAINTLLQSRGPVTALLCTDGFRDSTEDPLGLPGEALRFHLPGPRTPGPQIPSAAGPGAHRQERPGLYPPCIFRKGGADRYPLGHERPSCSEGRPPL